jgi:hypothetical protein
VSAHSEEERFFCFSVQVIEFVCHLQRGAQELFRADARSL